MYTRGTGVKKQEELEEKSRKFKEKERWEWCGTRVCNQGCGCGGGGGVRGGFEEDLNIKTVKGECKRQLAMKQEVHLPCFLSF